MMLRDLNNKFSASDWIDQELKVIEKECKKDYIPLIDRDAAELLKLQLKIMKAENILEIGTAYGFSTLLIAKNSSQNSKITTIEVNPERALKAKKYFDSSAFKSKIDLKVGDAFDILMYLKNDYDFIFLDAAKGQYFYLFEYIFDLLAPGGLLLADNVLYKGKVLQKGKTKAKIRTIVNNLKKYLKLVMNHPQLDSTIIAVGDGMALSRRKDKNE